MKSETVEEYKSRIGRLGGNARAKSLSKKRRQEIARNAIAVRWNKSKKKTK